MRSSKLDPNASAISHLRSDIRRAMRKHCLRWGLTPNEVLQHVDELAEEWEWAIQRGLDPCNLTRSQKQEFRRGAANTAPVNRA